MDYELARAAFFKQVQEFRTHLKAALAGFTVNGKNDVETAKDILKRMRVAPYKHCPRCNNAVLAYERWITHHTQKIKEKHILCAQCSWPIESETWVIP